MEDACLACSTHQSPTHTRPKQQLPKPRYRATCCVKGHTLLCFGGHDGTRHLNDVSAYDFETHRWATLEAVSRVASAVVCANWGKRKIALSSYVWTQISLHASNTHHITPQPPQEGIPPLPRDSHTAVVHHESLIVFGGSTGAQFCCCYCCYCCCCSDAYVDLHLLYIYILCLYS